MDELLTMLRMKFDYTRELLTMGLILARTLPMCFLVPFLGGQQAPPELKMSLGVLIALLVWPLAQASLTGPIPIYAFPFLLLMLKETLVGFAIGFAVTHIFAALETAGRFIDTARGAAMSEVLVPTSRSRATPIGTLYNQLMVVLFTALGGHYVLIETFCFSFARIPLNASIALVPGFSPFVAYSARLTSDVMLIATLLAAPAIAATFLTDLVFGVLNRVAPQLNAYFMAMPVKAIGALALMLVGLQPFLYRLVYYIGETLLTVQNSLLLLAPR